MQFRGSKVDLSIDVDREKLINILIENKAKHKKDFEESLGGYREALLTWAKNVLALAEMGKAPRDISPAKPESYEPQYDRALGMLKLSTSETVSLSAYDYARFVEDDWDWKDRFAATSAMYK